MGWPRQIRLVQVTLVLVDTFNLATPLFLSI
ncbi:hypothetical protein CK203_073783 [Vitis vinifera]|uniref:Uncharacterized protein n=1 Tax=Vitis vinifera TaxID=29760 RepID=A0A438DJ86_VITVI|nr:hypothetical protein CK203_073783 [Vitis vinifera]